MEVYTHSFLTSALGKAIGYVQALAAITPGKTHSVSIE
jgi:hypothetical protein